MAQAMPTQEEERQPFRILYEFQNRHLRQYEGEQRKHIMERFKHVSLHGDAELLVAAAPREDFPKSTEEAMGQVTSALVKLYKRPSYYYEGATFPSMDTVEATTPLLEAGHWYSYVRFGDFERAEVSDDGTIDERQPIFKDKEEPRHAAVRADYDTVKNLLDGSVLSAWYDENYRELTVQALLQSSENTGNHREFFLFTDKRIYAFDFWTS